METKTYQKRRQTLTERHSRTLFVISSGSVSMRSHSVGYRFKTPSDFFYLSGVETHDAVLVLTQGKTFLFSDFFKSEASVWGEEGFLSQEDLLLLQGVEGLALDRLKDVLLDLSADADRIAAPIGRDSEVDRQLIDLIAFHKKHRRRQEALSLTDSRSLIGNLRLIKTAEEISLLREAARRSSKVHRDLLQQDFSGQSEVDVCNWIEAQFMLQGMRWTAYETIVGAGERSTLLHARATNRRLQKGELVLIDAGAEWKGYCADITRVLPVGQSFSKQQRHLYQVVLTAQKQVIDAVRIGETLANLHELALASLTEGLLRLGMKTEQLDMQKLMPHGTSHWLGLDVHDPASYVDDQGEAIRLNEGMTFTVEPGLYLRDSPLKDYQGLGIRIEDNVVVTLKGCEVLTDAPKELGEIEELAAQKKVFTSGL